MMLNSGLLIKNYWFQRLQVVSKRRSGDLIDKDK